MKITLFLLLFVTFQAYSHATYSQSTRISIPRSELRVGEILDKIEAQTEYLFVYNKKSVDVRKCRCRQSTGVRSFGRNL